MISGLINGLNGQNIKEIFYENGTLKEKGLQNKAGSRTGGWKFYYENGSLLKVGTDYDEKSNFVKTEKY